MEALTEFMFQHAPHAHWIIFGALILAGFNLPISEDLMIILSALLASTVIPEHTGLLFLFLFMGCFFSDIIVYSIGRILRKKLYRFKWFRKRLPKKKLEQARTYYAKHGFFTLLVGRFIPFGVRNCLFLTAGMGKMSFGKFLLSDGIACFISNSTLFWITFALGKNGQSIFPYLKKFNLLIFSVFIISALCVIFFYKKRKKKDKVNTQN